MKISQDRIARTVYIDLSDDTLATGAAHDRIALDYDADHNIVGIEILDVDAVEVENATERARFMPLLGTRTGWGGMPRDSATAAVLTDRTGKA
jgi:uncharacterized protein YuzE